MVQVLKFVFLSLVSIHLLGPRSSSCIQSFTTLRDNVMHIDYHTIAPPFFRGARCGVTAGCALLLRVVLVDIAGLDTATGAGAEGGRAAAGGGNSIACHAPESGAGRFNLTGVVGAVATASALVSKARLHREHREESALSCHCNHAASTHANSVRLANTQACTASRFLINRSRRPL